MSEIKHRTVETNGIHMHIAESGAGPVVLCHGFPESWYSWRHQLHALQKLDSKRSRQYASYGQTDRPEQLDRYTLLHLVGDVVGLLDALGTETAVIVGQIGRPVAWYAALCGPIAFAGVIGLSVRSYRDNPFVLPALCPDRGRAVLSAVLPIPRHRERSSSAMSSEHSQLPYSLQGGPG